MFVVASIAMLRERSSGTLERLMSMPVGKLDLLIGYALAFGLVAVVQTALLAALSLGPLDLSTARSPWILIAIALGNALLGMALGLFVSAFAHHRVPGRAVHARDRAAAAPPVRPLRGARRDGRMAGGHLLRPAADLRLRRARAGQR